MATSREYHIVHAVGRGSFGTVYRAIMKGEGDFSKPVAVKILNASHQGWEEVARRLRDEARLLGMIQHRSILQVDGLVQIAGRWAVVMEFVEGCSLRDVREAGGMPIGAALEAIGEIAGALHVAYSGTAPDGSPLRLIHRDIKPDNILVTQNGQVKLLDFGIARADFEARESETRSLVMGSIGYMAPERFDMRDGPEGDVYALGVTAYELITGERFKRTSASERRHKEHLTERLATLSEKIGELPEVLALIERTLAFDEHTRPTARELEQACRTLRRSINDSWLAEWCDTNVPPLLPDPAAIKDDDELSGMTLMEGAAAEGFTEEIAAPVDAVDGRSGFAAMASDPRSLLLVALVALMTATVVGGAGLYLLTTAQHGAPAAVQELATVAPPPVAPPPPVAVARVVDDIVDPASERPIEPLQAPPAAQAPVEAPRARAPRPAKVEGVVTVSPPSVLVALRGAAGDFSANAVPPGTYDVLATFPGQASPTVAGKVTMPPNGAIRLVCDSMFMVCTAR